VVPKDRTTLTGARRLSYTTPAPPPPPLDLNDNHSNLWDCRYDGGSGGTCGTAGVDKATLIGCAITQLDSCTFISQAITQGQTLASSAQISQNATSANFVASWVGSTVLMTLTTPAGVRVDPINLPAGVTHSIGLNFDTYTVSAPQPGTWGIELFGADIPAGGESVSLIIDQRTPNIGAPNSPPVVTPPANTAVPEGVQFSAAGGFSDPDSTSWTGTVNYGDGIGSQALPLNGTSFNFNHTYADNGTYTVTVTVTDDAGAIGSGTTTVTVNNVPPVVLNNRPSQAVQYSDPIASVSITATDVAADMPGLVASTSFKKDDGSFQTGLPTGLALTSGSSAGTWSLAGKAQVAPGVYTVRITVTDKDGGAGNTDVGITVTAEDARVTYSGALFASTASVTSSAATITLSATIQDITAVTGDPAFDPDAGDIRNATATFVDRDHCQRGALYSTYRLGQRG
jgi:PKD domain/Putative Ig domain